jgi:hypothetical protein
MQQITDVQISGAARQTGLIGPGADDVSITNLKSFLKVLGVPVEDNGPFSKASPARINLRPAGVGAGAQL